MKSSNAHGARVPGDVLDNVEGGVENELVQVRRVIFLSSDVSTRFQRNRTLGEKIRGYTLMAEEPISAS